MNLSKFLAVAALVLAGCGTPVETGDTSAAVKGPTACPAIAILCPIGHYAKSVGNCHQVCVPDRGVECTSDDECTIYCITTPCPVGRCVGGQCQIKDDNGGGGTSGSECKPACGDGEWCQPCRTLDGVQNVCLPVGAVC